MTPQPCAVLPTASTARSFPSSIPTADPSSAPPRTSPPTKPPPSDRSPSRPRGESHRRRLPPGRRLPPRSRDRRNPAGRHEHSVTRRAGGMPGGSSTQVPASSLSARREASHCRRVSAIFRSISACSMLPRASLCSSAAALRSSRRELDTCSARARSIASREVCARELPSGRRRGLALSRASRASAAASRRSAACSRSSAATSRRSAAASRASAVSSRQSAASSRASANSSR